MTVQSHPFSSLILHIIKLPGVRWWWLVRVALLVRDCIETRTQASLPHVPSARSHHVTLAELLIYCRFLGDIAAI